MGAARHTLVDALWLLLLATYIVAGLPVATFHGDEAMQIHASHDYATAFLDREPRRLMAGPPYEVDSDQHLRLINGSVNRYAIGLAWHLAGLTVDHLPPAPGWDWRQPYDANVTARRRPWPALLHAARLPSALFLALSAVWMFALGRQLGGRSLAYVVSALYTVNPMVLLNGRRAMMEGSLLCFGSLTMLMAARIGRRVESGGSVPAAYWGGVTLAAALTLASKHSGLIFVASAFGWIRAGCARPRPVARAGGDDRPAEPQPRRRAGAVRDPVAGAVERSAGSRARPRGREARPLGPPGRRRPGRSDEPCHARRRTAHRAVHRPGRAFRGGLVGRRAIGQRRSDAPHRDSVGGDAVWPACWASR